MATQQIPFQKPVEDSVPKVEGEVAVGEDLTFQRRWWIFERTIWSIFTLLIILALLGVFGRGYLAKAERRSADGSIDVRYDRVQRTGTPSMLAVSFGPEAIRDGKIQLFVTESMVKQLGAQRIIPAPLSTTLGAGGLTYVFPANTLPATVEFALQPDGPGSFPFSIQLPGSAPVSARVVVMP